MTQPVLIVMGTADPDFPDPLAEAAWISNATNGTLVLSEGSGHYPQADRPDLVADAIIELVREGT